MRLLPGLLLLASALAQAQIAQRQIRVVLPTGNGAIPVHFGDGWEFQTLHLYDDGPRPVFQTSNSRDKLAAAYILFPNDTRNATADSCRNAVMGPLLKDVRKQSTVQNVKQSSQVTTDGRIFSTASYFVEKTGTVFLHQQNVYAFLGDRDRCAEIHLSKVLYQPADEHLFNAELEHFRLEPDYTPDALDYFSMGSLLTRERSPDKAELYYNRALDTMPTRPADLTTARVLTDQISMAFGISGNFRRSRDINQSAIARDPDYPLYYYNLACADAEQGNAPAARTHLQQAYDRRSHVLQGEKMPDPTKDESFLKLKGDKAFWSFVQSLPKS